MGNRNQSNLGVWDAECCFVWSMQQNVVIETMYRKGKNNVMLKKQYSSTSAMLIHYFTVLFFWVIPLSFLETEPICTLLAPNIKRWEWLCYSSCTTPSLSSRWEWLYYSSCTTPLSICICIYIYVLVSLPLFLTPY